MERETWVSSAATPQTSQATATVHDTHSVKVEKTLHVQVKKILTTFLRDHIHPTFIPVYCYNCSISLSVILLIFYCA